LIRKFRRDGQAKFEILAIIEGMLDCGDAVATGLKGGVGMDRDAACFKHRPESRFLRGYGSGRTTDRRRYRSWPIALRPRAEREPREGGALAAGAFPGAGCRPAD